LVMVLFGRRRHLRELALDLTVLVGLDGASRTRSADERHDGERDDEEQDPLGHVQPPGRRAGLLE